MKTQFCLSIHLFVFFVPYLLSAQTLSWEKHFNGGSNLSDKITAMTLDNDCNVYVTGQSDSIGQGSDILTIKYDLNGIVIWKKRWDGVDHLDDVPSAIKVDNSGNVYVCGKCTSATTGADWISIKYDSNGDTLWTRRYNNIQTNGNLDDEANDMALASNGNLFVTGYSINAQCPPCAKDFYTIRYDAGGNQLNATSVGSGNPDQVGKRIVENANNVFMLGDEPNYLKLVKMPYDFSNNSQGNIADFSTPASDATSLFVDGSGNIYVAGTLSGNIVVKKFNSSLSSVYSKSFSKGFNTVDGVAAMAVDGSGYIYLVGFTINSSGNKDMWLIKCDNSTGDSVWTKDYVGSANGEDEPAAILLQGSVSPDILVCGYLTNAIGNKDMVLLKYHNSGTLFSTQIYDMNGTDDIPTAFSKDAFNNLFVAGYSGSSGSEDFTTLKYCNDSIDSAATIINSDYLECQQIGAFYQWYKDGVALAGETQQGITLTPYGNGNYFCVIERYCCNKSTAIYAMNSVGVSDAKELQWSIFPNPTKSSLTISGRWCNCETKIIIQNVVGEIVVTENIFVNHNFSKTIPIHLPKGLYFIKIANQISQHCEKIIVE